MVRGSGSESGDKESNKSVYDGTLKRWPQGKIKLKSTLFNKGLWNVVEKGPSTVQASPVSIAPGDVDQSTIPALLAWYYAGRDNEVHGPCSAEELTGVFNRISQTERLTGESIYVHHVDNTAGKWEPWSENVSRKVNVQSTLEANLLKLRTPQFPFGGPESAVRMLTFSGTTPASPTPSARDRELGQQRPCTEENDRAALHVLVILSLCSMEAVRRTAARSLATPARAPYPRNTPRLVLIRLAPSTHVPPVVTSCLAQKPNALRPTRTN